MAGSTRALLSDFNISSLSRVTSPSLNPGKHWYVHKKEICGIRLAYFFKNEIFRRRAGPVRGDGLVMVGSLGALSNDHGSGSSSDNGDSFKPRRWRRQSKVELS